MSTTMTSTPNSFDAVKLGDLPNLAFIGQAGAGKTTCANYLRQTFGYVGVSFASVLKDCAANIWGEEARMDRGKLQGLGIKVREIDESAWLKPAQRRINEMTKGAAARKTSAPLFVNDDCRFMNEFWMLRTNGFCMVRVQAPESVRVDRLMANGKLQSHDQLKHATETGLNYNMINPEHKIANYDITIHQLHEQLDHILNKERARS